MPFEKGNTHGRKFSTKDQPKNRRPKGKTLTEYLRELGEAVEIDFTAHITNKNGSKKILKSHITADMPFNEVLANQMWADAINGNYKVMKEILDRVEGKPKQAIDMSIESNEPPQFDLSLLTHQEKVSMLELMRKSEVKN